MVADTATMDMVLVCREEEVRAHFILWARSPVFHSMLTLDTSSMSTLLSLPHHQRQEGGGSNIFFAESFP